MNQYPELVSQSDNEKMSALNVLATKQLSFKSGSEYLFEEIGKTPSVPFQMIETIIYSCKLTFNIALLVLRSFIFLLLVNRIVFPPVKILEEKIVQIYFL